MSAKERRQKYWGGIKQSGETHLGQGTQLLSALDLNTQMQMMPHLM